MTYLLFDCRNQTDKKSWDEFYSQQPRIYNPFSIYEGQETIVASGWPFLSTRRFIPNLPKVIEPISERVNFTEHLPSNTLEKEVALFNGIASALTESTKPSSRNKWDLFDQTQGSTMRQKTASISILPDLTRLFTEGKEQEFEDGKESQFSRELIEFIRNKGQAALDVLIELISGNTINVEVAAESLRWIGRMRDTKTYETRRWLLEQALFSEHGRIRDGAALGLASMNDPHAIRYIQLAIDNEKIDELRVDLKQIMNDLGQQWNKTYALSAKN